MNRFEKEILNYLLDKYESSRSFIGDNQKNQSFSVKPEKLFPSYADSADYETYKNVSDAVSEMEKCKFVKAKRLKNGVITAVILCTENIPEIYSVLKRIPKKDINTELAELLNSFFGYNELLDRYCRDQLARLENNKKVQQFDGDIYAYKQLLTVLSVIMNIEKETYQRDFSAAVLHDSKAFEKIRSKVVSVLFSYGDFPEKETVLEELNIIRNPGHVYFKGSAEIKMGGQVLDIGGLSGDIGLSSSMLSDVDEITLNTDKVITIENLTTFNHFNDKSYFAVYLGGYHNQERRRFIQRLYQMNPHAAYYHFGDIDAGGFYILLHLRRKTGVPFQPYKMDISTLKDNLLYTKKLTDNDRTRLGNLLNSEFKDTISFMLENNCKLEQEALDEK